MSSLLCILYYIGVIHTERPVYAQCAHACSERITGAQMSGNKHARAHTHTLPSLTAEVAPCSNTAIVNSCVNSSETGSACSLPLHVGQTYSHEPARQEIPRRRLPRKESMFGAVGLFTRYNKAGVFFLANRLAWPVSKQYPRKHQHETNTQFFDI